MARLHLALNGRSCRPFPLSSATISSNAIVVGKSGGSSDAAAWSTLCSWYRDHGLPFPKLLGIGRRRAVPSPTSQAWDAGRGGASRFRWEFSARGSVELRAVALRSTITFAFKLARRPSLRRHWDHDDPRMLLQDRWISVVILPVLTQKRVPAFDQVIYRKRNTPESAFCQLNHWHAVTIRCDTLKQQETS